MKRFMNTVFVFVTLTALMLSVFGASPVYAVEPTRPQVTGFGIDAASVTLEDADGVYMVNLFTASDDTNVTHWKITTTSAEPLPSDAGWNVLAVPDTMPATPFAQALPTAEGFYTLYPWVMDAAGNVSAFYYGNPAATPEVTLTVDRKPVPDVWCPYLYTNSTTISCQTWFTESVTGFEAADITLGGTATTRPATVTNWRAFRNGEEIDTTVAGYFASHYTFDLTLTTPLADGSVTLGVAAGVAQDQSTPANGNVVYDYDAGTLGTQPYTVYYDTTAPVVVAASFSIGTAVGYNVPVTGFSMTDAVGLCGDLITTTSTPPAATSPDWKTTLGYYVANGWDAPETPVADPGYTLYPWVLDCAGNVSAVYATPPTTGALPVETVAPTLVSFTASSPTDPRTNADSLVFLATFSEGVKDVDIADFAVGGTSTALVTAVTPGATADLWLVTVSGGNLASFNGTVNLDPAVAPTINDLVGNAMVAPFAPSGDDQSYTVDNVAPTVTLIDLMDWSPTDARAVEFSVIFSEQVTQESLAASLGLFTTNLTGASIEPLSSGNCMTCTVEVNTGNGNGVIRLDIVTAGVKDRAGNTIAAPYTTGPAYTITKGVAPTVPTPLLPKNSSLVSTYQPLLDWSTSSPVQKLASPWYYEISLVAVDNASWNWYYYYLYTTTGSSDPLVGLGNSKYDFASAIDNPAGIVLPANTTFAWKVRAYNGTNQYSAWSKTFTFRTPLTPPVQAAPANGEVLETTSPELSWQSVEGAAGYTVTLYKTGETKGKSFKVKAPAYSVVAPGLMPATNYEWTVKTEGKNSDKVASVSGKFGFKTSAVTPLVPVLKSPSNNALVAISNAQPLVWNQVLAGKKGEPAAHHYEVQVSQDPSFVQNYSSYDQTGNENFSDMRADAVKKTVTVDFLMTQPGRTYYWRVRSWSGDIAGTPAVETPTHSAWSKVGAFKVKFTRPSLLSPTAGDPNLLVDTTPTLLWYSNNGLWKDYKVIIYSDAAATKVVKTYTIPAPTTQFTLPVDAKKPLTASTQYWWRVQISGPYGSVFSKEIGTFKTEPPAP